MSVKEDVTTENPVCHPSSIRSMIQKYERHLKPEGSEKTECYAKCQERSTKRYALNSQDPMSRCASTKIDASSSQGAIRRFRLSAAAWQVQSPQLTEC